MRVAIVHYHLRPGGVTRVIQHALSALSESHCRAAVLTGCASDADSFMPGKVHIAPGLDYPRPGTSRPTAALLAASLEATAQKALGGPPDIWHFHNHTLGKNTALSQAVHQMASQGRKLLLQIHDFPEDGRPANYQALMEDVGAGNPALLNSRLYPQANHVHYATINRRDHDFLCQAGIPASRVHFLPNACSFGNLETLTEAPPEKSGRLFIYPTRAIRRKNTGEFLLWAAIANPGDRFAVTLAPTSPADLPPYRQWVALAQQLNLPVAFEIGLAATLPFPAPLSTAAAIVTTRVAVGFGLAFLEPWLVGRPLAGRDLPEISEDFKAHAINLDGLYRHVLVPRDWIDLNIFRRKIACGYAQWLSNYGRPADNQATEWAIQAALANERIDFGRLDEALQQDVIRRLAGSHRMRSELEPRQLFAAPPAPAVMIRNRETIRRMYGMERYRQQLEQVYASVGNSTAEPLHSIAGNVLLDQFLAPDRFYLLRT